MTLWVIEDQRRAPGGGERADVAREFPSWATELSDYPDAVTLPDSAHTAQEAAAAIGVEVGAIVKSLVFLRGDVPVLVLCSGANMVDADALGLTRASAKAVREATGQPIGGVAPYGHPSPLETLVDEDLMTYDVVWSGAGRPERVFPMAPVELLRRTGGTPARVRVRDTAPE